MQCAEKLGIFQFGIIKASSSPLEENMADAFGSTMRADNPHRVHSAAGDPGIFIFSKLFQ